MFVGGFPALSTEPRKYIYRNSNLILRPPRVTINRQVFMVLANRTMLGDRGSKGSNVVLFLPRQPDVLTATEGINRFLVAFSLSLFLRSLFGGERLGKRKVFARARLSFAEPAAI